MRVRNGTDVHESHCASQENRPVKKCNATHRSPSGGSKQGGKSRRKKKKERHRNDQALLHLSQAGAHLFLPSGQAQPPHKYWSRASLVSVLGQLPVINSFPDTMDSASPIARIVRGWSAKR